jgi:hypothetical protein
MRSQVIVTLIQAAQAITAEKGGSPHAKNRPYCRQI